jgi:predicted O-methyltransferase YrrM
MYYRPFMRTPEPGGPRNWLKPLRHPLFACMGLRPVYAQHTRAEHEALQRWAAGRSHLVEIGVGEGGSACALAQVMAGSGTLTLIDPFHLSRWRRVNATKRVAHAAVSHAARGTVVWIEEMSSVAVRTWETAIDFLLIDGNHEESAVLSDWAGWHPFVSPCGLVAFHDARVFRGGWPELGDGPVRIVNQLFRGESSLPGWHVVDEVHSLVLIQRRQ